MDYVDDSKATNPHAAGASLAAYPRVVWIAGGLLKGADVDPLVAAVAAAAGRRGPAGPRPRPDRRITGATRPIGPTWSRCASGDDERMDGTAEEIMTRVVAAAAGLARPGDTVLLAPAAASMDVFRDYAHRGRAFADAVHGAGPAR